MKFHHRFLKLLRKQIVTDTRTHTRSEGRTDNVKTVYPPTNTVCGGYNKYSNDKARYQWYWAKLTEQCVPSKD